MRTLVLFGLFGLLGLFGCFDPSLGGTTLSCDPSHGCPDGFSCIGGRCVMGVAAQGGCVGAGYDVSRTVSGTVYACGGVYSQGQAGGLCAAGYSICTSAMQIEYATCEVLPGFYLADVPARQIIFSGTALYQCLAASTTGGQTPGWAGCGGKGVEGVVTVQNCTGSFVQAQIGTPASGLTVTKDATGYTPLTPHTSNTKNANGVLCCKN